MNIIPVMTHPLSKAWNQPSRDEILIDDVSALMTEATYLKLYNYEDSIPTAVYEGKMWRNGDFLCWWIASPDNSDKCKLQTRKIITLPENP